MNLKSIRLVVGANLLAATCLLMQGCTSSSDKKAEEDVAVVPTQEETKPAEPVAPAVEEEIKPVAMTTAYTIKKGDTISGIAAKYNLRWQDVVAVNAGLTPNKIRVGQVIQLPGQVDLSKEHRVAPAVKAPKTSAPKGAKATAAVAGANYVVKSGDTLGGIAHHFGVKVAALREANSLKNDKIVVGQKLKVPGAKAAAETKKSVEKATAPKTAAPKAAVKSEEKPAAPADAAPAATVTPAPATESAPLPPPPVATPAAPAAAADTAAPAAAAAPAQSYQTHQVKEGEDLYGIAIRWGCSPADLKALNNLTGSDLKPGTVLKIPN